jgi:heme exporter protein D
MVKKTMRVKFHFLWVLLLGVLLLAGCVHSAWGQTVTARVDRTAINEGDSLRFVISAKEGDSEPDLSPLQENFDVLSTSTSSRVNIINGHMDSTKEWTVILSPKESGTVTIPAIQVGSVKTEPITITVGQGAVTARSAKNIFLEVEVDPRSVYVQSKLVYTVRLYQAVNIRQGGLTTPQLDDAIVERLGDDKTYQTTVNGRGYHVTERRYAIYPQSSGDLTIPATVFSGEVIVQNRNRSSIDPFTDPQSLFGMDPFNMFQSTKPVRVRSKKLTVNVLPRPDSFHGNWWLPAENVTLSDEWAPQSPVFKVGEPVTRTIKLSAQGVTATQLPDLSEPDIANLKIYPDAPTKKTYTKGGNVLGERVQKIAFVPTQAGTVTLPEVRVEWWDIKQDRARIARLPARTIKILPAPGTTPQQTSVVPPAIAPQAQPSADKSPNTDVAVEPTADEKSAKVFASEKGYWSWLAIGMFAVWLLTVFAWAVQSRKRVVTQVDDNEQQREQSMRVLRKEFKQACFSDDPNRARKALLKLARMAWGRPDIHSLRSIAEEIEDIGAKKAILNLDSVLYSNGGSSWDGQQFWKIVAKSVEQPGFRSRSKADQKDLLPQLYSIQELKN